MARRKATLQLILCWVSHFLVDLERKEMPAEVWVAREMALVDSLVEYLRLVVYWMVEHLSAVVPTVVHCLLGSKLEAVLEQRYWQVMGQQMVLVISSLQDLEAPHNHLGRIPQPQGTLR